MGERRGLWLAGALLLLLLCAAEAAPSQFERHGQELAMMAFGKARQMAPFHQRRHEGRVGERVVMLSHGVHLRNASAPGTNSSRPGSGGAGHPPAAMSCDELVMTEMLRLMAQPACASLLELMGRENPALSEMCANLCWDKFLGSLESMAQAGCIDSDVGMLDQICNAPAADELCASEPATQCVDLWVEMGCPQDADDLFERCADYTTCAYRAVMNNRCPPMPEPVLPTPTPVPSVPRVPAVHRWNCSALRNCSGHGECVNGTCRCHPGFGRTSAHAPQDCSEWTAAHCAEGCSGHGNCVPTQNGTMACECHDGYAGPTCSTWQRCANLNFCSGHGVCPAPFNGTSYQSSECVCAPGYTGHTCGAIQTTCPNNCFGHGTCHVAAETGEKHCECDEGFSGLDCGTVSGRTCINQCSGLGECIAGLCACSPDARGVSCNQVVQRCSNCGNGYCRNAQCECVQGFTGALCDTYDPSQDAGCTALDLCNGFGVCRKVPGEVPGELVSKCACFQGFTGPTCAKVDVATECPNFCSGHGRCVLLPEPHCACREGWSGPDCGVSHCSVTNGKVCNGHGICDKSDTGSFSCTCDPAWTSTEAGSCVVTTCPADCSGHGACNVSTGLCACDAGFSGYDCAASAPVNSTARAVAADAHIQQDGLRMVESDPDAVERQVCVGGCSGHGLCNDGTCECEEGFAGVDCSIPPVHVGEDHDVDDLDLVQVEEGPGEAVVAVGPSRSMSRLWD